MTEVGIPPGLASFVSIDVETTGLDPSHDLIIEIGAVKMRDGAFVAEFDTLVSIDRPIPSDARRVHGITDAMLAGKPNIGEALALLLEFAGDCTFVEHSYQAFDIAFLEHAHGGQFPTPCINTCTLSRRLFPHLPKHSLAECCKRFHIENEQSHRALSDARATARLLQSLLQLCATRYPRLEDLITVAAVERAGSQRRTGGKRRRRP